MVDFACLSPGRSCQGIKGTGLKKERKQEGSPYLVCGLGPLLTLEGQGKAAPFPAASPRREGTSLTSAPARQLQPWAPAHWSTGGEMVLCSKL